MARKTWCQIVKDIAAAIECLDDHIVSVLLKERRVSRVRL